MPHGSRPPSSGTELVPLTLAPGRRPRARSRQRGQWFCKGTPISLASTGRMEANPPTSLSRCRLSTSRGRRLPGIREPAGSASPDRPQVGPLQMNKKPAAGWVGQGVRGRSQHRAQKTIREARCSALVEAAGPAPARTRCRETRVGRRGSLYQSCRDITRRPGSPGSGSPASHRGRVLRLGGLGTRAEGAGPR